ncbi:MAG: hypothetical protein ACLP4V_22175 [Methylocella sp.]
MTIDGRDELGEVQREQLRVEKGYVRLKSGEIGLPISNGKWIKTKLRKLAMKNLVCGWKLVLAERGHPGIPTGNSKQNAHSTIS